MTHTTNPWYKDTVIYGLDVGRFYDANGDGIGDFKGLIAKLDYLVELGVGCLWLLPFYQSTGHDNGYDITNHIDVSSSLGTLEDFRMFMYAAKTKGLKVIVDLVIHHTSTSHPWFVAGSTNRSSKYKDYYIWREQISPDVQTPNTFPTVEEGVWQYEENAHAYYRHQFYRWEPDLNVANKEVQREIYNIVDFWLALGVDGFRVDAAGLILNHQGMLSRKNTYESFFEALRDHVECTNKEAILIGEADVKFPEIGEYFGDSNRLHLLYNFLLNNVIYSSLVLEDVRPLETCLKEQEPLQTKGVWANFVRNLDELNLQHLAQSDRDKVMDAFAPEYTMRLYGRGIRRRLPPMLHGDPQWIRMTYSLLFALPGVPTFMYGEEIGMGDDMSLDDRNSVRLPMQWNTKRNGGFSGKDESEMVLHASGDPNYGYEVVNVSSQRRDKDSLLNFFRTIMKIRSKQAHLFTEKYSMLELDNKHVLGIYYRNHVEELLLLHNFSSQKEKIIVPADITDNACTVLLGEDALEASTLEPHGFSWIKITKK